MRHTLSSVRLIRVILFSVATLVCCGVIVSCGEGTEDPQSPSFSDYVGHWRYIIDGHIPLQLTVFQDKTFDLSLNSGADHALGPVFMLADGTAMLINKTFAYHYSYDGSTETLASEDGGSYERSSGVPGSIVGTWSSLVQGIDASTLTVDASGMLSITRYGTPTPGYYDEKNFNMAIAVIAIEAGKTSLSMNLSSYPTLLRLIKD